MQFKLIKRSYHNIKSGGDDDRQRLGDERNEEQHRKEHGEAIELHGLTGDEVGHAEVDAGHEELDGEAGQRGGQEERLQSVPPVEVFAFK